MLENLWKVCEHIIFCTKIMTKIDIYHIILSTKFAHMQEKQIQITKSTILMHELCKDALHKYVIVV